MEMLKTAEVQELLRTSGLAVEMMPSGTVLLCDAETAEACAEVVAAGQGAHGSRLPLVEVHRRLSRDSQERLRRAGVPYVDTAGNAWLNLPGRRIWVEGRRGGRPAGRPGQAGVAPVDRPAGLRVLFALLVDPTLTADPLRMWAEAAGVSVGTAHGVRRQLRQVGHLVESGGGEVLEGEDELRERWVRGYVLRLEPTLERSCFVAGSEDWWRSVGKPVVSGDPGYAQIVGPFHGRGVTVFGDPPWEQLRRAGRLRPDPAGGVLLKARFWGDGLSMGEAPFAPDLLQRAEMAVDGDPRLLEMLGGGLGEQ